MEETMDGSVECCNVGLLLGKEMDEALGLSLIRESGGAAGAKPRDGALPGNTVFGESLVGE